MSANVTSETDELAQSVRTTTRSRRGFAAMSPERRRELASKGGRAAHDAGTAHRFTPEEARAAGRKGGLAGRHRRVDTAAQGVPSMTEVGHGETPAE